MNDLNYSNDARSIQENLAVNGKYFPPDFDDARALQEIERSIVERQTSRFEAELDAVDLGDDDAEKAPEDPEPESAAEHQGQSEAYRRAIQDGIRKYVEKPREAKRAETREKWRLEKREERAAKKATPEYFERELSKTAAKLEKKLDAALAKPDHFLAKLVGRTPEIITWWKARERAIREHGEGAGYGRIAAAFGAATKNQAQTRMHIIAQLEARGIWPKRS